MPRFVIALVLSAAAACAIAYSQPASPREDCTTYTDSTITIVDKGERGWVLERTDGAMLALLDNKADAEAALAVAKRFSAICYIGRDNKRPTHSDYVMVYWKPKDAR